MPPDESPLRPESHRSAAQIAPVRCRWTADEPPASQVVNAVAAAADSPPDHLEPLYRTVDPDALNRLFPTDAEGADSADVLVSFRYAGHDVLVRGDGTVLVTPPPDAESD